MNFITKLLISLALLFSVAFAARWLYNTFPTTLVLFLSIGVVFLGVLTVYVLWSKSDEKRKLTLLPAELLVDFPELEEDLLNVMPFDFSEKIEKQTGKLHILGLKSLTNVTLHDASFNKMLDEQLLKFNGYQLIISRVPTIEVGDNQFSVSFFKTISVIKGNSKILEISKQHNVITISENNKVQTYKIKEPIPVLLFEWD